MVADSDLVHDALRAFERGEMVVCCDDDSLETESNLIFAGSGCTPQQMAFAIRHSSGIICAPISKNVARRLGLKLMVASGNGSAQAFTQSVDGREGLTTGISAIERASTVRMMADGRSLSSDFVQPGHVFPILAQEGGVLIRSGSVEACVDLCRSGSRPEVGVMAQLMNDDGTIMRGRELRAFVEQNRLVRLSVTDLIAYRQVREKLVRRVAEFPARSKIGLLKGYAFLTPFDPQYHLAFVYGELDDSVAVPARLHRADLIGEVFQGAKSINGALRKFQDVGSGILIYLRDGSAGVPVTPIQDGNRPQDRSHSKRWREVGLGAQILRDLGVRKIRLLSSAKTEYVGLKGFDIEVVSVEPSEIT